MTNRLSRQGWTRSKMSLRAAGRRSAAHAPPRAIALLLIAGVAGPFAAPRSWPTPQAGGSPQIVLEAVTPMMTRQELLRSLTDAQIAAAVDEAEASESQAVSYSGSFPGSLPARDNETRQAIFRVLQDPDIATVQMVRFDADRLGAGTDRFVTDSLADLTQRIDRLRTYARRDGRLWLGQFVESEGDDDPTGMAILREFRGTLSGIIQTAEGVYTLRSVRGRLHALTSSSSIDRDPDDVDKILADADGGGGQPPALGAPAEVPDECRGGHAGGALDLVFGITKTASKEASASVHDLRHWIEIGELLMEQSLRNSGLDVDVRVKKVLDLDYAGSDKAGKSPSQNFQRDLDRMRAGKAGLAELARARKNERADIALLVRHHEDPKQCGRAGAIGGGPEDALAVVNWKCIIDKYSFAHEVGHILGAWHDPTQIPAQFLPVEPSYAHGYAAANGARFATIMAYHSACKPCGRVWHWSNPDKTYRNVKTGSATHNNACVLRRNLDRVSKFGDSLN